MHDAYIYLLTHWFTLLLLGLAFSLAVVFLFASGKSHYLLYALLVWFPLETLVLRYIPIDYYALGKYFPELVLYSTALISWGRYVRRTGRIFPRTPLNKWMALYFIIAAVSLIANQYSAFTWLLGVRQLTRFALVFLVIILEDYPTETIKKFVWLGGTIAVLEALLAIVQYFSRGALDPYLFFSDTVSLDGIQLEGLNQFWAPGQRVFATLGRYDRLGSFLVVIILFYYPWLYRARTEDEAVWSKVIMGVLLVALLFTYSRASWLGCLAGILFMAHYIVRDKKLVKMLLTAIVAGGVVLLGVVLTNSYGGGVLDKQSQTVSERLVEAVSWYSWKQNYQGYGRIFFLINTPRVVVRAAPLVGVGPGNYGGGVAAALVNTTAYDKLHLPFGIQNVAGQIDSNWMSIWGEVGTLGLIAWVGLFVEISRGAWFMADKGKTVFQTTFAQGLTGACIAIMVFGIFGPYFEMRTLMMYFWLAVGVVFHYWREDKLAWNFVKD